MTHILHLIGAFLAVFCSVVLLFWATKLYKPQDNVVGFVSAIIFALGITLLCV